MTTATTNVSVDFDPRAQGVLDDMRRQMQGVREVWGRHDPQRVINMAVTYGNALARIPEWGDAKVFKDGDLSLLIVSPHITFGLVGFRDFRADAPLEGDLLVGGAIAPMLGRFCWTANDEEDSTDGYCLKPIERGEATCTGHVPSVFATPVPYSWSFHS